VLKAITYARLCRALVYRGDLPRLGGDEKVEPVPISDNETVARVAYERTGTQVGWSVYGRASCTIGSSSPLIGCSRSGSWPSRSWSN